MFVQQSYNKRSSIVEATGRDGEARRGIMAGESANRTTLHGAATAKTKAKIIHYMDELLYLCMQIHNNQ